MSVVMILRVLTGALICGAFVAGCATKPPGFNTNDEHYQQIIERQKAGIEPVDAIKEKPSREFTYEEYEQLGDSHVQQGHMVIAAVQYEKALELDPTQNSSRYKVAVLYLKHGKADRAYDRFHEILDYDFDYAPAYVGMGSALLKMGNAKKAESEFRQALVFDSENPRAHNYLGIIFDRHRQHKKAIEHYQKALALETDNPAILNNLGMAYFLSEQYQEAAQTFRRAIQNGANHHKIWNNLGLAFSKLDRYADAYRAFLKGSNSSTAYNNLGVVFLEAGKSARAMNCFQKAIESQPKYYEKAQENLRLASQETPQKSQFSQGAVHQQEALCL